MLHDWLNHWKNAETFWLNVTNLSLGVVLAICVLAFGGALVCGLGARLRRKLSGAAADQGHIIDVEGLGLTMADGGVPHRPNRSVVKDREGRNR